MKRRTPAVRSWSNLLDGVNYREADASDLRRILAVQHEAFGRVAHELRIPPGDLPPLMETERDLRQLLDDGTRFFVATDGDVFVGAVRGTQEGRDVHVGRLVVLGSHTRQGIGTRLMRLLEGSFPGCTRLCLFTGVDAHAALTFYRALGYAESRVDATGPVALVWLEKAL